MGQVANRLYNGEFLSDTLGEVGPRVGELSPEDHIGSQFRFLVLEAAPMGRLPNLIHPLILLNDLGE